MYEDVKWKENGKLKLLIIVGTRPEIIRLAAVIKKCRKYFDTILAHTGQNYDYNLNGVFFRDLELDDPEVYLDAVGDDLGATMGNIIDRSYKLMAAIKPDAVLVLGDTNSCLSVIGAKRLHIPIFHMEAGNRCKDECLPEETNRRIVDIISDVNLAYSEHARRYLADCGLPKERTFVTGSPMAEVLSANLEKIRASDVHARLGLEKGKYILLSAHREENIDTETNFLSLFTAINRMAEKYDMPILYSCHPRSRKRLETSTTITACRWTPSPWSPIPARCRRRAASSQASGIRSRLCASVQAPSVRRRWTRAASSSPASIRSACCRRWIPRWRWSGTAITASRFRTIRISTYRTRSSRSFSPTLAS